MIRLAQKQENYFAGEFLPNNRIIDLVFLAMKSHGDEELEISLLENFSHEAQICCKNINEASEEAKKIAHLENLLAFAKGVGANSIVTIAILSLQRFEEFGEIDVEYLADIDFAVKETQQFIAQMLV